MYKVEAGDPGATLEAYIRVLAVLDLEGDLNLLVADDRIGRKMQDLALEPSPDARRRMVHPSRPRIVRGLYEQAGQRPGSGWPMTSALHVWSARLLMTVARSDSTTNGTGSRTLAPLRWTPTSPWTSTPFFAKPELGNFGIFLDSSPDRWGQTLMKRREALQAKYQKRPPAPSTPGTSSLVRRTRPAKAHCVFACRARTHSSVTRRWRLRK